MRTLFVPNFAMPEVQHQKPHDMSEDEMLGVMKHAFINLSRLSDVAASDHCWSILEDVD